MEGVCASIGIWDVYNLAASGERAKKMPGNLRAFGKRRATPSAVARDITARIFCASASLSTLGTRAAREIPPGNACRRVWPGAIDGIAQRAQRGARRGRDGGETQQEDSHSVTTPETVCVTLA